MLIDVANSLLSWCMIEHVLKWCYIDDNLYNKIFGQCVISSRKNNENSVCPMSATKYIRNKIIYALLYQKLCKINKMAVVWLRLSATAHKRVLKNIGPPDYALYSYDKYRAHCMTDSSNYIFAICVFITISSLIKNVNQLLKHLFWQLFL